MNKKAIKITIRNEDSTILRVMREKLELEDTMRYIYNFWLDAGIVLHKNLNDMTRARIKKAIKNYSVEQIKDAIINYAEILHSDNYYWTYVWTLSEFASRGIDKFLSESLPYSNFATEKHKLARGKIGGASDFKSAFIKRKRDEDLKREGEHCHETRNEG